VYTSSCHKSEETFSTAVLSLWSISSRSCDSDRCPFVNWRAMLHTQHWLRPNVTAVLLLQPAGNMHQRGYPSHGMTGRHNSVTSICLACHVYTSSCHKSDETFSTAVLCLRSISNAYCDSERCPFCQWASRRQAPLFHIRRALAHTVLPKECADHLGLVARMRIYRKSVTEGLKLSRYVTVGNRLFWNYPHPKYELRYRGIYIEEPITFPKILSEHLQTQDESTNTILETPNSQFTR